MHLGRRDDNIVTRFPTINTYNTKFWAATHGITDAEILALREAGRLAVEAIDNDEQDPEDG